MKITNIIRNFWLGGFVLLLLAASNSTAQLIRESTSPNWIGMSIAMNQFRQDLGGQYNGVGNSYTSGYREIDWEDLPVGGLGLNGLYHYYNTVSPRGVLLNPIQKGSSGFKINYSRDKFQQYHGQFQAASGNTIFSPIALNHLDISFVIPGTSTPASVSGFGVVFSDVDDSIMTWVCVYDEKGDLIDTVLANDLNGGMSFVGIKYDDGRRISRVSMRLGNLPLPFSSENSGGDLYDKVAMDNIIYGEPRAIEHHASDFDGDGAADMAVYRPSEGNWYVMNSGSNVSNVVHFGLNGDIPADGDFDGDSRSDFTVFRPSNGTWYSLASSNGQTQTFQFGSGGDKPVARDYDKDGKTDFAVWRPTDGNYYVFRSSDNQVQITNWGKNGDIPIGASGF